MIDILKQSLSVYLVIPGVLLIGLYLSIKLKWLQITHIAHSFRSILPKAQSGKGTFSSFGALTAVLGGNLGTGNIAGIAVALSTGGPGALFWMWVMAGFGAIVKFAGCFLGVLYRKNGKQGFIGGPMYYLENGLGLPFAAKLFCIFTILCSFSVGNLVQINSIALPLTTAGISPLTIGIVLAVLLGMIMFGGVHFFTKVSSFLVPLMALIYVSACLFILAVNYTKILPVLSWIFEAAFNPIALAGGALGFGITDAIRVGFDRGLFATDAGVGLAPILHSQVNEGNNKIKLAFEQGVVSIMAPLVVMVICMLTGLVLLLTGAWQTPGLESTNICIRAFQNGFGSSHYGHIVTFTLCLFAFTTMLTWEHCAEKALEYLFPKLSLNYLGYFRVLFVLVVPLGVYGRVNMIWSIADILLNLMLLLNLIGIIGLSSQLISKVKDYLSGVSDNNNIKNNNIKITPSSSSHYL